MSARDEPVTLPPPAGEEDAYTAATKVGAMPAEVLARLREEGLLPEEDDPDRPASSHRPNSAPMTAPRGVPRASDAAPMSGGAVPAIFSSAPPGSAPPSSAGAGVISRSVLEDKGMEEDEATAIALPPFEALVAMEPPRTPARDPMQIAAPAPLETPIAFAAPPPTLAPVPTVTHGSNIAPLKAAPLAPPRPTSRAVVVALVLVVVLAIAFFVALISLRR